jgi:DNA-binding response OmpR family regulator
MTSILVVEDDTAIRGALSRGLTERGHAVTLATAGLNGLELLLSAHPEVVLLDLGLPDVDGLQVISMIRAVDETPIIVITARDDDEMLVRALDAGADDYVIKPFSMAQIDARIRAVLRRGSPTQDGAQPIVVGGLTIDPRARTASLEDAPLELSRKEFDLLVVLASRVGEVITKRELLSEVWQQGYGGGERTVDVHLSWLRRKLGETAAEPAYLHTVRGVGVRMVDPTTDGYA